LVDRGHPKLERPLANREANIVRERGGDELGIGNRCNTRRAGNAY
jgi:hypothetical protein